MRKESLIFSSISTEANTHRMRKPKYIDFNKEQEHSTKRGERGEILSIKMSTELLLHRLLSVIPHAFPRLPTA